MSAPYFLDASTLRVSMRAWQSLLSLLMWGGQETLESMIIPRIFNESTFLIGWPFRVSMMLVLFAK